MSCKLSPFCGAVTTETDTSPVRHCTCIHLATGIRWGDSVLLRSTALHNTQPSALGELATVTAPHALATATTRTTRVRVRVKVRVRVRVLLRVRLGLGLGLG